MNTLYTHRWYHFIWRWIYTVALILLLPLGIILLLFKSDKTPGKRNRNRERFGLVPKLKPNGILIHCVSVGEVNAAKQLVLKLKHRYPDRVITLSTTSSTGAKLARQVLPRDVQHIYLPLDIPILMRFFFNRLKPHLVVVVEVEIWPNMLHQCLRSNIPIVLANARMTNESVRNYKRLAYLYRPSIRKFVHICAQGQQDFKNFLSLGVYKPNLSLTNNMKFDIYRDPKDDALAGKIKQQLGLKDEWVFVAGSTHEDEELICLDIFKTIKQMSCDALLIIVPRHPHRFDKVAQICQATGLNMLRASALEAITPCKQPDILLVDGMGMLKACYQLANVAFVGGSFVSKGGHNALEPALYSVPIVMGPSTFNNPVICEELARTGGLQIVGTPTLMSQAIINWLQNPRQATDAGLRNQLIIEQNRGAVELTMNILGRFLDIA